MWEAMQEHEAGAATINPNLEVILTKEKWTAWARDLS